MEYNKLLSIIIPTYNMEALLPRCLDSLLIGENQHLLEVWVVNDGSKDRSSEIGHEYMDKHPEVFNVIDKPNGNYGSCINAALSRCTGKYIKVLDSDDFFKTDQLAELVVKLQTIDVDMLFLDYSTFGSDNTHHKIKDLQPRKVLSVDDISINSFLCMHQVAYRTKLLQSIDYKQTEGVSYSDNDWMYYPVFQVNTVYYLPLDVYQYYLGRDGQTMDQEVMAKRTDNFLKIFNRMLPYYVAADKTKMSVCTKALTVRMLRVMSGMVYKGYLVNNQLTEENLKTLKELDAFIKVNDEDFYVRLATNNTSLLGLQIPHVKWFRAGKYSQLKFATALYRWVRSIHRLRRKIG